MFCSQCGQQISDNAKFCRVCGASTAEDAALVDAPAGVSGGPGRGTAGQALGRVVDGVGRTLSAGVRAVAGGRNGTGVSAAETVPLFKPVAIAALALFGVFLLGFVHLWLKKIPFIYLSFIFSVGYGVAAGCLAGLAFRGFRRRDTALAVGFLVVFALVAEYGNWFWFISDDAGRAVWAPGRILSVISRGVDYHSITVFDSFSDSSGIKISGFGLALVYLGEAAIIAGAAYTAFRVDVFRRYFCDACRMWAGADAELPAFYLPATCRRGLLRGDFQLLEYVSTESKVGYEWLKIKLSLCSNCGDGLLYLYSLHADEKGKVEETSVGEGVPVTRQVQEEISAFISETMAGASGSAGAQAAASKPRG